MNLLYLRFLCITNEYLLPILLGY